MRKSSQRENGWAKQTHLSWRKPSKRGEYPCAKFNEPILCPSRFIRVKWRLFGSLALEAGINLLIMDDSRARAAAEIAGLKPRGTLWLLLEAIKKNALSFDDFFATIEAITNQGFYLREDLYLRVIREARRLTGS